MAKHKKSPVTRRKAAATTDIVSDRLKNARVPRKWKSHHDRLIQVRQYLITRQNDLVKDAKEEQPSFSLHMADAATDSFDRDLALSRASAEQDAVYEIDEALDRIREGTYGICELTGKPIEASRLEAIPWTRFSMEAEKQLEKQGAMPHAHLAPREPVDRTAGGDSAGDGDFAGSRDDD